MWNPVSYFENINNTLKLTKGKYKFCRSTGINNLEEVLSNMTSTQAFLVVEDTNSGETIRPNAGYYDRRSIVVYILKKYNIKNQIERETYLSEIRLIRKKILAKLIKDSGSDPDLQFLDKKRIPYREVPGQWIAGTCGLYFVITLDESVNLIYDEDDYE